MKTQLSFKYLFQFLDETITKKIAIFSIDKIWAHQLTMGIIKLTPPMLRPLLSKAQGRKDFWKRSKPCYVGIHRIALTEYSPVSTHVPGYQSFSRFFVSFCIGQFSNQQQRRFNWHWFLHHFALAKLATSSNGVKRFLRSQMPYSLPHLISSSPTTTNTTTTSSATAPTWNWQHHRHILPLQKYTTSKW